MASLDAYPSYYAQMGTANASGPDAPDLAPPQRVDPAELYRRIDAGEWVVDLRERRAFAAGHLPGSLYFGLDGNMATYLGWLIPWGTPLTLLGEGPGQVAEAQRELARIGIDRPAGAATGDPAGWAGGRALRSVPTAAFADLAAARAERRLVVLDVRRNLEWSESHIDGALRIPLHELQSRDGEVPDGEVWVHCASGYRASVAASLLARDGRHLTVVDDDFTPGAAAAGLVPAS